MPVPAVIRSAAEPDLVVINEIYNHYVLHSDCTYQEEPEPIESRRDWFWQHDNRHPIIVAELDSVVGWGSLSPFHPRSAYRHTAENSIYVSHQHHRQGIGALLLHELIIRARALGHHAIIAGIDAGQTGSIALHQKFQFQEVGRLKQVGLKFGRLLDVVYMELIINEGATLA